MLFGLLDFDPKILDIGYTRLRLQVSNHPFRFLLARLELADPFFAILDLFVLALSGGPRCFGVGKPAFQLYSCFARIAPDKIRRDRGGKGFNFSAEVPNVSFDLLDAIRPQITYAARCLAHLVEGAEQIGRVSRRHRRIYRKLACKSGPFTS